MITEKDLKTHAKAIEFNLNKHAKRAKKDRKIMSFEAVKKELWGVFLYRNGRINLNAKRDTTPYEYIDGIMKKYVVNGRVVPQDVPKRDTDRYNLTSKEKDTISSHLGDAEYTQENLIEARKISFEKQLKLKSVKNLVKEIPDDVMIKLREEFPNYGGQLLTFIKDMKYYFETGMYPSRHDDEVPPSVRFGLADITERDLNLMLIEVDSNSKFSNFEIVNEL